MMSATISDYELYLYLSFVPAPAEVNIDWLNCDFDCDIGVGIEDESWWISEGVKTLRAAMLAEISTTASNATHVILLSAGCDSRAILGSLLEYIPQDNIVTATYGMPGAWDYEIAKAMSRTFGLRHEVFNLLEEDWEIDKLVLAASCLRRPVSVHQSYVRRRIAEWFGTDCIYWSGFMGGSPAGFSLPQVPNTDRRQALRHHINLYATPGYKDQEFLERVVDQMMAQIPWAGLDQRKFSLDQKILYGLREYQHTQSIVITNGFAFKIPFLQRSWVNFVSNTPYEYHIGKYLYRHILAQAYQNVSMFPSTSTAGMSLTASRAEILFGRAWARLGRYITPRDPYHSHPRTQYLNWAESLRHKTPLQASVYETLQELKRREIFDTNDIDTWWQLHQERKANSSIVLMNLSSLELLIKANILQ